MTQDEALAILKTGVNVFLTGEPGSGKTHIINKYITWLRERGVDPAVTASTGIAATHVSGMTIHSWSGIGVNRNISDWDIEMIQSREKTARRIIEAKVLIIDEISMLDADTLTSVDRVLRTLRRKTLQEEEPFGGLQVIFVGDFFQLPPVVRSGGRAVFAFESMAWKDANPIACYLTEQHRQDDADFLEVLGALRRGDLEDWHVELLRSRLGVLPKKEIATRLHTHNISVDRINTDALSKIQDSSRVFQMTSRGASALVEMLKKNCLSPETLELKAGAAVMFTRNNFDTGYVNGTLGTVTGFTPLGIPLVQTKNGTVTAEAQQWEVMDGNKVLASITQIPLRLAWAITVHKSQGMSLDAAIIDLGQAFEFGQGYVALSRVRSLAGLYLESFNARSLELHPAIVDQDRYFRAHSEAAQKKFGVLTAAQKSEMQKNFLRAIGAREARPVKKTESKKSSIEILREKYPNVGKSWSKNDDELLTTMFKSEKSNAEIGRHFGRKSSAIQARLGHLGLVEDFWPKKKSK